MPSIFDILVIMDIKESKLSNIFNLTSHEAKLYLAALNFNHATLSDLARKAGIARTAAYPPLKSLLKKGLMSSIKIKKRIHYRAIEPDHLKYILERERVDLEDIVGSLTKNVLTEAGEIEINYYAGQNGIMMAADIFLKQSPPNITWKTFEYVGQNLETLGSAQLEDYIKRRVTKGIRGKVIIPAKPLSEWIKQRLVDDKKELRETILVSPDTYPIEASIAVANDMVQVIGTKNELFSLLIKNRELAKTISSIHDMVWERFEPK